eukprot:NODE_3683_length_756_cov_223.477889.p9 GENE.NODE_3683_length_756_cov_223.477889~~NODE_3683_length_756_cov_223.477889.p9  ORF type:complete len:50 (+),score=35.35 NODE_3683_length_756_cov_223.477889:573-722(+)
MGPVADRGIGSPLRAVVRRWKIDAGAHLNTYIDYKKKKKKKKKNEFFLK